MTKQFYISLATLLCVFLLAAAPQQLHAQNDAIAKYFSKYMDQEEFTSIYISPRMFRLMGANKQQDASPEMKETIRQISGLRILSADSINGNRLYDEIFSKLNQESYEELMSIREPDSDVKFLVKMAGENKVSELLMLIGGDDSFFMMSIIGVNLDLDSVIDIADDIGPSDEEEEDDNNNNEEEE
ncbi:MAG: DUF4252 domain-containing protein [Bacteroidia bacterium]|nr:DUF4252 domain-containing protein [Bacteroidia bacterium]